MTPSQPQEPLLRALSRRWGNGDRGALLGDCAAAVGNHAQLLQRPHGELLHDPELTLGYAPAEFKIGI